MSVLVLLIGLLAVAVLVLAVTALCVVLSAERDEDESREGEP